MLCAVDRFRLSGQVVVCVVAVADAVGVRTVTFRVLHESVGEVVVVGGHGTRGGIGDGRERAAVVVAVRHGVAVFVGLSFQPSVFIVIIFYTIFVSVVNTREVFILVVGVGIMNCLTKKAEVVSAFFVQLCVIRFWCNFELL